MKIDDRFLDGYFGMINLAMKDADHAKAVELARRAIALAPAWSDVYNLLGHSLLELGKAEEAVSVLEENLKKNEPRNLSSHYLLGKAYAQLQQWERAREQFSAAIDIDPQYVHAYYGLSGALARLGRKEEADRYSARFKELKEKDEAAQAADKHRDDRSTTAQTVAALLVSAGKAYLKHQEPGRAEEHWLRALKLHPAEVDARRALAMLYHQDGRIERALEIVRELAGLQPHYFGHYLRIGSFQAGLMRFEEAEAAFLKVTQLAPRMAVGYAMLAKLYLDANQKAAEAPALARKAVEIEPIAVNYHLLYEACLKTNDVAGAKAAIGKAAELDPKNPSYQRLHEAIRDTK